MNLSLFLSLVTFVGVVCCSPVKPYEEDQNYISSVLVRVPEEERKQFLAHQLYLGYVLKHPEDVAINVSQDVTIKIFESFLRSYTINPVDPRVESQLCFPSGECVDTDDPGVYP